MTATDDQPKAAQEGSPSVSPELYRVAEDAADATEFVAGVITLAEFGERVRARYKVPAGYDWDHIEDVVLYDMFYEAGTQLGAVFVALQDQADASADGGLAARWHAEHLDLARDREGISVKDRKAQILTMLGWQQRARELTRLFRI